MPKRSKRLPPVEVPRLGPPVNLRPAGAHTDKRRKTRAEETAALRTAAFEVRDGLGLIFHRSIRLTAPRCIRSLAYR